MGKTKMILAVLPVPVIIILSSLGVGVCLAIIGVIIGTIKNNKAPIITEEAKMFVNYEKIYSGENDDSLVRVDYSVYFSYKEKNKGLKLHRTNYTNENVYLCVPQDTPGFLTHKGSVVIRFEFAEGAKETLRNKVLEKEGNMFIIKNKT